METIFRYLIVMVLFISTTLSAASGLDLSEEERLWLSAHPVIKMGIDPNYAPYSFLNNKGEAIGIAIDFLTHVEKKLDIKFQIVSHLAWKDLIENVQNKTIDAIATVVPLKERENFLHFTRVYLVTPLVIITNTKKPTLKYFKDFKNLRFALVDGYSSSKIFLKNFPDSNYVYVNTPFEGLGYVSNNLIDAYIGALGVNIYQAEQNGITNLKVNSAFNLEKNGQTIGVRKDWQILATILDKALSSLSEVEKNAIFKRWIVQQAKDITLVTQESLAQILFPWLIAAFGFALLGYILIYAWNRKLKKELTRRKAALEKANHIAHLGDWSINVTTKNITWSKELLDISGRESSGEDIDFETFSSWMAPDERDKLTQIFNTLLNSKAGDKIEPFISHMIRPDGESRWLEIRSHIDFDKNGTITSIYGTAQDISENKTLENKISSLNVQFNLFMEDSPYAVTITNDNHRIIYANPEAKKLFSVFNETCKQKIKEFQNRVLKEKKAFMVLKCKIKNEDSSLRVIGFVIHQNGEVASVGMLLRDITEEVMADKKLQEKDDLIIAQSRHATMGEMISMIAHQWRQPLSIISMEVNNMLVDIELDALDKDVLKEMGHEISNQTQYLSQTIDDFRYFFKPNKEKEYVKISTVAKDAIAIIKKSLINHNIEIEEYFTCKSEILIYPRELLQVYINLIKNAQEALLEKQIEHPKVSIRCYEDATYIYSDISDNAGGIPEDIITKIFDSYFSTKGAKEGTGLGLYMCKSILEKHLKGTLTVKNSGDGACFTIAIKK